MPSTWGEHIKLSLFGESHGPAVGCVLDNLPSGEPLDWALIRRQNGRRRPGQAAWATPRSERDEAEILSGVYEGRTTGTPLCVLIRNADTHSPDYAALKTRPRPGHADLTGRMRYAGAQDPRGSGHFSGRLTAPLVTVGAICQSILAARGIRIAAHALEIGGLRDREVDPCSPDNRALLSVAERDFPTLDTAAGRAMQEAIALAREEQDSLGGVVEVLCYGFPGGVGAPFFGGIEPRLAGWYFALPAVKGLEFGAGFAVAKKRGSENNDSPEVRVQEGRPQIRLRSNNAGGADGGISTGMPIVARLAFKPPASIARPQDTVDLATLENVVLEVPGRHDPCIVPRAVPVVEAVTAIALLDLLLESGLFAGLPRRAQQAEATEAAAAGKEGGEA